MPRTGASTDSRTYLGSDAAEDLYRALAAVLAAVPETPTASRPALVAPDGTEVALPRQLQDVLLQVAQALQAGRGVNVAPLNAMLATQEAANYPGISRPTLLRLLDAGEVP